MSSRDEVDQGRLVYTCECGWVDLGHANPTNARSLWYKLLGDSGLASADGLGYKVHFAESAKFLRFNFTYSKSYWIRKKLSKATKESIALSIFKEVSVGFENLQTYAPGLISDSGFSAEDLVSDLIGFYRAARDPTTFPSARPFRRKSHLPYGISMAVLEVTRIAHLHPYSSRAVRAQVVLSRVL